MPRRIKAVLKAKGVQPDTSKVYLIKWPEIVSRAKNLNYVFNILATFNKISNLMLSVCVEFILF